MLMGLATGWLMMAVAAVAIISYIFSLGLDAVMRDEGFGAIGNAGVITAGFFLSIWSVNAYGVRLASLTEAALAGLAGAFVFFAALTVCKAALNRL